MGASAAALATPAGFTAFLEEGFELFGRLLLKAAVGLDGGGAGLTKIPDGEEQDDKGQQEADAVPDQVSRRGEAPGPVDQSQENGRAEEGGQLAADETGAGVGKTRGIVRGLPIAADLPNAKEGQGPDGGENEKMDQH